jgi:hypothetical protein
MLFSWLLNLWVVENLSAVVWRLGVYCSQGEGGKLKMKFFKKIFNFIQNPLGCP